MSVYDSYLLPWLLDLVMRSPVARRERERLVPLAEGAVVEIGVGSGLNLPFYRPDLARLYGLDPSSKLLNLARKRAARVPFPVELVAAPAESIPATDATFNSAVTTWTLCTVADPLRALAELRRVLKPGGRLIFVEHGRSPDGPVRAWQDRLTPLWSRIGGGCHLNRPIDDLLRAAGFEITRLETGYLDGPRPLAYLYRGLATPASPAT